MMPFITEEVWLVLNQIAPLRGLGVGVQANLPTSSLMIAKWPQPDTSRQDESIESRFAKFQAVLGAVREIRTRQNIAAKMPVRFGVCADAATCELLQPMVPYFESLANVQASMWGMDIELPTTHAAVTTCGMEVIVDLRGLIDVSAEIARLEQQEKKLLGLIAGKESKLNNANFTARAPADVVTKERDSLNQMLEQLQSIRTALADLRQRA